MFRSFISRVFYSTRTYYELLQISPKASQDEIKKAFLNLSKSKPQDKVLVEAYEVLSKPSLRYKYDKGILTVRNGNIIELSHSVWDDAVFKQRPLKSGDEQKIKVQEYESFGVQWLIITLSTLFVLLVNIIEGFSTKKELKRKQ